jgi:hypothetical protein
VREMAMPPTCSTCGSILLGYGWSKELNFPVHFCTKCREKEDAAKKVEKEAA